MMSFASWVAPWEVTITLPIFTEGETEVLVVLVTWPVSQSKQP